jgi:hypothetical protein
MLFFSAGNGAMNALRYWNCAMMPVALLISAQIISPMNFMILIANSCQRRRLIFKRLSQDEGRTDLSKNLRASPFNNDLSIDSAFSQIHLAGQYL